MIVNAIVAIGKSGQIGLDGDLPWYCPEDLKWFRKMTLGATCIVGHKTYTKLPALPGRNVVVDDKNQEPVAFLASLGVDEVWIIGGRKTYERYAHLIDRWHIGRVPYTGKADTFFDPSIVLG